ncbi:MAG: nucleotidyltransferase domain-containing protein [Spirochaetes bacterium]|nr:nucleotidyltransferase domain-containing protein [Spirochaetota bacterium]
MRQIVSSDSVKVFSINSNEVINTVAQVSKKAKLNFPEIEEIWLFGSFAKGQATGLSDIDILVIADTAITNPIDRIKPYYVFFANCLHLACDVLVIRPEEKFMYSDMLKDAIQLA